MAPDLRRATALLLASLTVAACSTGSRKIPAEYMSVPMAAQIGSVTLAEDGTVTPSAAPTPARLSDGAIRVMGAALLNGDKILAENVTVESLDLSESRGEVAFSAKRENNFDIALISTDGGAIHWMPNDPADELAVQWAPRGNKISYVIRAHGGDVVRTLHIPTAFQFAVPFTNATIHALAWDPQAEHFAVAYSTPDSSDRVEVLDYKGEKRRTAIPPARQLDVEVASFAANAIVMRPREIRYDEKLPLVVWMADDFSWSDARAALLARARVAIVVATDILDEAFWRATREIAWIDSSRPWIVSPEPFFGVEATPGARYIVPGSSLPADMYSHDGTFVTVAPAVVQSFAAGYIADELERDPPTNGSSR
ncbi:MAG TPA: hypothetical protein VEK79_15415 [Thermoanaerobaculia bacterium]|nr:hypothetical protein [Thermoanaerobaculia bacterium]